jgi:monoamine oxidase
VRSAQLVLNHSATNKTDRENTTTKTTNNLTTMSAQNRPQQSSSKEELLDAHFMAKKVQKEDQVLIHIIWPLRLAGTQAGGCLTTKKPS